LSTTSSPSSEKPRKVVLITGASSGIGKTCAEHLAAKGYRVFGAQRHVPEGKPQANDVESITMDVDDDDSVNHALQVLCEKTGRLDAVVNNAGFALMGSIEDTSVEEARAQMETNFFGVLRVCRAALPIMRKQGRGHIINISSLAGVLGLPFSGLYSASKFALEGMSESLRLEVRRFGISIVLVEPGDFSTQLPAKRRVASASQTNDAYREAFTQFKAAQEKDESKAPTPEPIAYLIERILQSDAPRLRYSIGMLGQRIVVPLKRLLPQRLFEWALRKALGL
jgi:NAD(P)-dependent dehydrogenase (short-subunit alcohol dehydrogenase family)